MIESLQQAKEQMGKFCHYLSVGCVDRSRQRDSATGRVLDLCLKIQADNPARYLYKAGLSGVCSSSRGIYVVRDKLIPCTKYDPEILQETVFGLCTFRKWRKEILQDFQTGRLQLR